MPVFHGARTKTTATHTAIQQLHDAVHGLSDRQIAMDAIWSRVDPFR